VDDRRWNRVKTLSSICNTIYGSNWLGFNWRYERQEEESLRLRKGHVEM
jgi:hypothetical protein